MSKFGHKVVPDKAPEPFSLCLKGLSSEGDV